MPKKRIFILGAGLAGLSAAWHLRRKHIDCHIFEKEKESGGLCRSKNIGGFIFDYTGHLLHFRQAYTYNLIKGLLGDNLAEHERNSWIYVYNRYIRYPFQANLYGLPLPVIKECLLGFAAACRERSLKKNSNDNFLSWIKHTFGSGISRHFMVPYNTKFWTLPPQKMTCDWLEGFIPVPSLNDVIEGTIEESRRQLGYSAKFWYPKKGGIAEVPLALSRGVKNMHTGCEIIQIDIRKKEIRLASGGKEKYSLLISTLPLPALAHLIKELPVDMRRRFNKLRWNSIFNLNLAVDKKDYSARHWIYFPQKELSFFRAGFPHNFSQHNCPKDQSSLYIEVSYSPDRPVDKNKIIPRIKRDLDKTGLVGRKDRVCFQDINDIEYGYPIYDKNYQEARTGIINYLQQYNIAPCGRYGSWRYMSMEDALLDGKKIAESDKVLA